MKIFQILLISFFLLAITKGAFPGEVSNCLVFNGKRISGISFSGLKITEEQVVKRELDHKKQDEFDCDVWGVEKKRLEGLDIFSLVDLKIKQDDESIKLEYQFKELPLIIPFLGGKKTDQDGIILGPAAASLNFLGKDIRLEAYGRTSVASPGNANELQAVASSYWLGNWPVETWVQYILTDSYNPFEEFPEKSHFLLFALQHRVTNTWRLKYHVERFSIGTDNASTEKILLSSHGNRDNLSRLGFGIVRDTRESLLNPHRGLYTELMYTHSAGDANFGEILADARSFVPMGNRHILHFSILGQYRIGRLGAYDRLHVGGGNTLRAYHPLDDGMAGASEILSFFEYRYEWIRKKDIKVLGLAWYYGIQLVAGADAAYLWDDNGIKDGKQGRSVYVGAHMLFPGLDRIRFELGNKAMRFKLDTGFSFGLWERTTVQRWRIR